MAQMSSQYSVVSGFEPWLGRLEEGEINSGWGDSGCERGDVVTSGGGRSGVLLEECHD